MNAPPFVIDRQKNIAGSAGSGRRPIIADKEG
jgi:hypothetical protein